MAFAPQIRIPASDLRGGTSKGVFFRLQDLPARCQQPGPARDALLLRVVGSPDPYGKQTDGMGGATSSTSKTVIVSRSTRADHDVDYLFGQVAIDSAFVDWSGNCGNLSAAVGPFAMAGGLVNLAAGGGERHAVPKSVVFGHPPGTLRVGAEASLVDGQWTVTQASMGRSARVLMEGFVRVPADSF
jgi:2-methylaconitate cis-trans-isomerase PrpF